GIIVCDFIDLEDEKNKRKVYEELKKEFRKDRAKVTVLPMTEFGLVQITRQRIRQSIQHSFTEACPACGGTGIVQSRTTTLNQLERWLRRFKAESKEFRLILRVNPSFASVLREGHISRLTKLMFRFRLYLKLETDPTIPPGEFHCISVKQGKDITDQFK
ncbi:MAG TPA: ribonuclease E/G, partial [Bacteroidota bacterium]|nr:ribonuclease E/G [Bacteroidota bacterium]